MTMSKARIGRRLAGLAVLAAVTMTAGAALAAMGQPADWNLNLQDLASPVMDDIRWFHSFLLVVITAITLFVLALLLTVMVQFNARANPTPSRTTHNTLIEVALDGDPGPDPAGSRCPVVQAAVPATRHAEGRPDHQGDRQAVVLDLQLSGQRQVRVRLAPGCDEKREKCSGSAPARGRQRDGRAGQQDRARAGHRRRRDPLLRGAVLRHQDRRRFRAASTRPGSRRRAKASITASARSSAARTTPSCRSRCASSASRHSTTWVEAGEEEIRGTAPTASSLTAPAGAGVALIRATTAIRRNDRFKGQQQWQRLLQLTTLTAMTITRIPTGWRRLRLFDQPQGHRHDVPGLRDHRRHHRRRRCRSPCAWSCRSRACRSSTTTHISSTCSSPRTA